MNVTLDILHRTTPYCIPYLDIINLRCSDTHYVTLSHHVREILDQIFYDKSSNDSKNTSLTLHPFPSQLKRLSGPEKLL